MTECTRPSIAIIITCCILASVMPTKSATRPPEEATRRTEVPTRRTEVSTRRIAKYWICTGPVASMTKERCRLTCGFGCFSENDYDDSICRSCGLRFNNTRVGSRDEIQFRSWCPNVLRECRRETKGQPTMKPTEMTKTQPAKSTTMPTTPQSRTAMVTADQRTRWEEDAMIGALTATAVLIVVLTLMLFGFDWSQHHKSPDEKCVFCLTPSRCWWGKFCRTYAILTPKPVADAVNTQSHTPTHNPTDQVDARNPFGQEAEIEGLPVEEEGDTYQ